LQAGALAVAATGTSVTVDTAVIRGAVELVLTDESRRAAMMCVGSVGIGRVARTLLGPTAAALAKNAYCPVAVIRSGNDAPPKGGGWIAVAVDDKSDAVLRYAMEEGRLRKAPVLALTARWQSPAQTQAHLLKQQIDSWIARYPDVVVRLVDAHGGATQYLEHLDQNVQLAVVGPADADFVTRLVGPHGHPILAHVDCSVLVVRP
jgi:nucleotide-binding universal stress UspA family protein